MKKASASKPLKVKFKVSQQRLWVAKKRGMPTGYGDTPESAVINAIKLKEKEQESHALHRDQANRSDREHARLLSVIDDQRERLSSIIKAQMVELSRNELDGWLMMSCAYLGTTDPHAALAEMYKRGVSHGNGEHEAADRVAKLMTKWLAWGDKK